MTTSIWKTPVRCACCISLAKRESAWKKSENLSLTVVGRPVAPGGGADLLEHVVAGFHIDVMDGQFVPELLYGPDTVRAVRGHTTSLVDVHLMVC